MTPEQIASIRARALEIVALCDALAPEPQCDRQQQPCPERSLEGRCDSGEMTCPPPIGGPGGCRGLEMHRGGCSPFCAQHRGDDCLACDDGAGERR